MLGIAHPSHCMAMHSLYLGCIAGRLFGVPTHCKLPGGFLRAVLYHHCKRFPLIHESHHVALAKNPEIYNLTILLG